MAQKIMWATVLFAIGFFWFYLGGRQFIYNFLTAFPLIKRFSRARVIDKQGAVRYTVISSVMWAVICGAVAFVVFFYSALHLQVGFVVGILLGLILNGNKLGPGTESNYVCFLKAYSRFITNPELRHAASEGDTEAVRSSLDWQ